jgi:hypothetical protein
MSMSKPLEIVGDTAFRTTDQKVRGSNPFERTEFIIRVKLNFFCQQHGAAI